MEINQERWKKHKSRDLGIPEDEVEDFFNEIQDISEGDLELMEAAFNDSKNKNDPGI